MPSQGSPDDFDTVLDDLADSLNNTEEGSLSLLCGDFNGDVGHLGGLKSTRRPSILGKKVINFFKEFSLFPSNLMKSTKGPVITFKGGMGSSTLDYTAIPYSLEDRVVSSEVLSDPILNNSDHYAVRVVINVEGLKSVVIPARSVFNVKWARIKNDTILAKYTSPAETHFQSIINDTDLDAMSCEEVDTLIDDITTYLVSLDKDLPRSKFKPHVRPYWNDHLTQLKKEKVRSYRVWKYNGRPRDPTNKYWCEYKSAKRIFRREIRGVQRSFEQKEMLDLITSAECDKNRFWRLVKKARSTKQSSTLAIRNPLGRVVHEIPDVVKAWYDHFSKLRSKNSEPMYDESHYQLVTDQVQKWFNEKEIGDFLSEPFEVKEVGKAINRLNKGKSTGCDYVSAEHLQFAGQNLKIILTRMFNRISILEYIPLNFRQGTQIPLYKGKNTCSLDQNNYRGITLLTSLNKVFEILVWDRMKDWWEGEQVISPLQGACRPGKSCVHSSLILQESIAVGLGTKKKVLVTYLDVSKAFDGVWIDGLFFQLRKMGVRGRVWRMLYASYQNFRCKTRICNTYSDWYTMECGIHQGGFLSLLKYTAFIDPLIRKLELSGLGCKIIDIPTSPVGYADDMASASLSKLNTDKSLNIIYEYARKWRYKYNAKKSAVMVYGETVRENTRGMKYRNFCLGREKVPEKTTYDHVGIKCCLFNNYTPRTEERISKGRRAFNAVASTGIKKGGISMSVCSVLYWSIVIPIVTYRCEVWVLRGDEVEMLRKFQRYIGRRCQRFPKRSPNYSAYSALGWLSIDRVIQIKKLMFLRTILVMEDDDTCKRILRDRAQFFADNLESSRQNVHSSPIFDILDVSIRVGLYDTCMRMITSNVYLSKEEWKKSVWRSVWEKEDEDCILLYKQPHQDILLFKIIGSSYYLVWWILAGMFPRKTRMCEAMATLVCDTNLLKSVDYRLKGKSHSQKVCNKCYLGIVESIHHLVMQCPSCVEDRIEMYRQIGELDCVYAQRILSNPQEMFHTLMGKHPEQVPFKAMVNVWMISGHFINKMYARAIAGRK